MMRKLWHDHGHNLPVAVLCAAGIALGWWLALGGGGR